MRGTLVLGVVLGVLVSATGLSDSFAAPLMRTSPHKAIVETRTVYPPKLVVVRVRFVPWAEPTVAQAHVIVQLEAARSGVSADELGARIACESTWEWWQEYEGHYGLGQFLPGTLQRGIDTIGSRAVVWRTSQQRVVWVHHRVLLSDGMWLWQRAWRVQQTLVVVRRGMLPIDAPVTHAWLQVRVMAEALAGRSGVSSSEWSCAA